MSNSPLKEILIDNPIIAAVSNKKQLIKAINSPCEVIFMLYGEIMTLGNDVQLAKDHGKKVFIHLDLVIGLSRDAHALAYINERIHPTGIITTKSSLARKCKEMKIIVIQRLFMLDSKSFRDGMAAIQKTTPDAIEIMPGIVMKIVKEINRHIKLPIITGGLISEKQEVIDSLNAGATSISTSEEKLWYS